MNPSKPEACLKKDFLGSCKDKIDYTKLLRSLTKKADLTDLPVPGPIEVMVYHMQLGFFN